eukprot:TRINITY_DN2622_c0_g1_i1.p1 TRINITY_DN2622_c0_g1~~TRINITY_DN2622_c0_g1_i1.p1  ORF type:complete len:131 (+),score=27.67 TRINITY_DN2622_c0_g1_i1:68-460(+)
MSLPPTHSHLEGVVVPTVFIERHEKLGGANKELTTHIDATSLWDRLDILLHSSSIFVILPGSIGTLQEFINIWSECILTRFHCGRAARVIAWRRPWEKLVHSLRETAQTTTEQEKFIEFVDGVEELEKIL